MIQRTKKRGKDVPHPGKQRRQKPYEPTDQERAAAQRVDERRAGQAPSPKFKASYDQEAVVTITPDHPDHEWALALLADALGTADYLLAEGILKQLCDVARAGREVTADELNFMLATVKGIGPRDPTEALLAVQMAAIHNATITAARRLKHVENIDQQNSASNMLNKLTRTFATQIEALKKYRSSGEQNIRVQHINVNADQAVVGVTQGGGEAHKKSSQSHAPSASSQSGPALLGHEQAQPLPLQSPSREGQARVPYARREGGSTEGKG